MIDQSTIMPEIAKPTFQDNASAAIHRFGSPSTFESEVKASLAKNSAAKNRVNCAMFDTKIVFVIRYSIETSQKLM
jgi:hypothetical protein